MRLDSWIALALFGLAVLYFSLTFTATFDLRDEGYLLMRSAEVAAGSVPHRDFADVYGPGVFGLAALALEWGDGQILAVRILVALFKALAVAAGYVLSRRVAPRWIAVSAALIGIAWWGRFAANLNAPYAALFSIPLGLAASAVWVWATEREAGRRFALGAFAAGLLAGAGIVFKQSLGLVLAYGLLLAAIGGSWNARGRGARSWATPLALVFLVASLAPVLPVARWLTPSDYALHLFPLRAVLVAVALLGWLRGAPPLGTLLRDVLPLAVGTCVVPLAVVAFYAWDGSLVPLLEDMFVLPFALRGYAQPAELPPLSLGLFVCVALAVVATALLLSGGRRREGCLSLGAAVAAAVLGTLALPDAAPALRDPLVLLARGPFALEALYLPGLLLVGLATSLRFRDDTSALHARIPILVVSAMLCFEVFPRAGHNLWILHGALAPLLALVLADLFACTGAAFAPPARRAAAAVALLAIPVWLVAPLVRTVVLPGPETGERRPLALERARGLRLDAVQRHEQQVPHVEALVAWLATQPPAPLLLLTNEDMISFLAERPSLFPDHSFALFLAGWGMLSPDRQRELDTPVMLARLEQQPDVLVIHRSGPGAAQLRRAMPRLRELVEREFAVVERFGPYRVLRRSSGPAS